jgi:hypothetical protein
MNYVETLEDTAVGTEVKAMTATDADSGESGRVTYSLVSATDNAFAIDTTTGAITTTKELNRETFLKYVLEVQASDHGAAVVGGALSANAVITFATLDSNDNDPTFGAAAYTFDATENWASGSVEIGGVTATDLDEGVNGELVFSISSVAPDAGGSFSLGSSDGKIYVKQVRFFFPGRNLHSRMPLVPTHSLEANMRVTNGIPLGSPPL